MIADTGNFCLSIVSHGQGALVRRLLSDLRKQGHGSLPIVLTLNIPEDESFLASADGLCITVIRNARPRGFGANHNAAFTHCRARWFAVLNPDVRLPDNPFPAILRATQLPGVGVLAPRVLNCAGSFEDAVRANPTPWSVARRFLGHKRIIEPTAPARMPGPFYWLAGMFLVFEAAAYRRLGGFDEGFFLYCEDYDICARFYLSGYSLAVAEETHVVHDARRTSRRSFQYLRWHVASLLRVWFSRPFWRIARLAGRA